MIFSKSNLCPVLLGVTEKGRGEASPPPACPHAEQQTSELPFGDSKPLSAPPPSSPLGLTSSQTTQEGGQRRHRDSEHQKAWV